MEAIRGPRGRFVAWRPWYDRLRELGPGGIGRSIDAYDAHRRYEFYGTGKDLMRAVAIALHYPPMWDKPLVKVSAEEFINNRERCGVEGDWEPKVDS